MTTKPTQSSGKAPNCPRCDAAKSKIVAHSPVKGVWEMCMCPVCFYFWRSTEPAYATQAAAMNPSFRIKQEDIPNFSVMPEVLPLSNQR